MIYMCVCLFVLHFWSQEMELPRNTGCFSLFQWTNHTSKHACVCGKVLEPPWHNFHVGTVIPQAFAKETKITRHGNMLVGGTLGGKSVCWKTLAKAKCILKSMGQEGALPLWESTWKLKKNFMLCLRGNLILTFVDSQTINVIQFAAGWIALQRYGEGCVWHYQSKVYHHDAWKMNMRLQLHVAFNYRFRNGELIYQVSQWSMLIFCCRSAKVRGVHRITVGPGHVSFVCLGMSFTAHMMLQPWWNGRMACCPPSWGGCARNLGTNLPHNQWSMMKQHWNCTVNNLQSEWLKGRQTESCSVLFVLPCVPLEYDSVAACRMKNPMRSGWCWTGQSIPCGSSPWIQCWTTTRQALQVSFHDRR